MVFTADRFAAIKRHKPRKLLDISLKKSHYHARVAKVGIATLRRHLDAANIHAPIQVFGALDPLSACLYFLAGAEIFDGLAWLRFAYTDGCCTYLQNYGTLRLGLTQDDDFVHAKTFSDNFGFLRELQLKMRTFATTKDFSTLQYHSEFLSRASDALSARFKGGV